MACDPNFGLVSLLVDFDGTNGQTTFTDLSNNSIAITNSGGVTVSTSNPMFGTGAGNFNGGDELSFPLVPGGPLDLSTGDWTIEFWINTPNPGGIGFVFYCPNPNSSPEYLEIFISAGIQISAIFNGQSFGTSSGFSANTWTAIALVCASNVMEIYVNGIGTGTPLTITRGSIVTGDLKLGGVSAGGPFTGLIDEFRITKGLARYTSNYTPATAAFGLQCTTTTVPDVTGDTLSVATSFIIASSLIVGTVTSAPSGTVPAGDVISQNPVGGTTANIGDPVDLVLSSGPPVTVPNVVGSLDAAAQAAIIAASLTVGVISTAFNSALPGTVLSQNPVGGTPVGTGSPVDLVESIGPSTTVPDLTNTSVTVIAPGILIAADLIIGAITYETSGTIIAGNIIRQAPVAGTIVTVGSAVKVVVSSGLPPLTVPDLFGLNQADAELALTSLGLVVGAVGSAPSQFVPPNLVQAQNPSAGVAVAVGTIVSFVLSKGILTVGTLFDFEATVISQYANSPTILQLVNNLNLYIDQSTNFANFFNFVWNVDTAVGFGLDIWGKIVDVSRLLQIPNTTDYVGFDNGTRSPPDWQSMGSDQPPQPAVGGAMFTGYNATTAYLLGDDAYRQLILAKAFANICTTTAPAINQILQNLYGPGTAFVLNTGPMSISYNLTFTPSAIQLAILEQSGVIPTPPGVSFVINTNV